MIQNEQIGKQLYIYIYIYIKHIENDNSRTVLANQNCDNENFVIFFQFKKFSVWSMFSFY